MSVNDRRCLDEIDENIFFVVIFVTTVHPQAYKIIKIKRDDPDHDFEKCIERVDDSSDDDTRFINCFIMQTNLILLVTDEEIMFYDDIDLNKLNTLRPFEIDELCDEIIYQTAF